MKEKIEEENKEQRRKGRKGEEKNENGRQCDEIERKKERKKL